MVKKVIIVHGTNEKDRENMIKYNLPPQNEREWIGWIKSKLDEKEIICIASLMPENWDPKYKDWKNEIEKIKISKDDILVGWSSGGGFLVRWLGETKKKIKKLILVAPAIIHSGEWKSLNDLLKFEIDKSVKDNVDEIIIFVSNDESKGIKESVKIFYNTLGGKIIELEGKGHFTGHSMGTNEFPELLEEVLK